VALSHLGFKAIQSQLQLIQQTYLAESDLCRGSEARRGLGVSAVVETVGKGGSE